MLIRGSSSVLRCWIRFRRSRRVSTVFRSPSGGPMMFVGPLTVIWPSYQNTVVGRKCSWSFPPIIATPRHRKRAAAAESVFSTRASLFPRFHDLTVRGGVWDAENWIFLADVFAHPSLPWRLLTPCRLRWNTTRLSSHGMQTTLDAILRISRVLAFLAILILLLSLNKENALLHTHSKFTHQHHVRMEQSKQVSEPNHHFHHCPIQKKHNQFMFNNIDFTTIVVTNTHDEEVWIPAGYYTIGEIIVILNTTADAVFSISTKASSDRCIWIQSLHTPLIFKMLQTSEKSSVCNDERSFYLLRLFNHTCYISLVIATWFICIHRWSAPPIWRLPVRTTTCSPHWSLTIPQSNTVDRWRTFAFQW